MSSKQHRDDYLAKAKAAEEQAEKSKDEANRASWLRLAASYHRLAAGQVQHNN